MLAALQGRHLGIELGEWGRARGRLERAGQCRRQGPPGCQGSIRHKQTVLGNGISRQHALTLTSLSGDVPPDGSAQELEGEECLEIKMAQEVPVTLEEGTFLCDTQGRVFLKQVALGC